MTKKELEKELAKYKAYYDEMNPPPKPPTLKEIADGHVKELNIKINELTQKCYDVIGVIPHVKIVVKKAKNITHSQNSPITVSEISFKGAQRDAVDKLICYCLEKGDWDNTSTCLNWIAGVVMSKME